MDFLSNIPADIFSISAVGVGIILIGDLNVAEQNALGNWFMLIGQYLETYSAQQQVINNKNGNTTNNIVNNSDAQIKMMEKVREAIDKEINNLKNNNQ